MTQNNDGFVPVIDIAPYLAGTAAGKRRVAAQPDDLGVARQLSKAALAGSVP